MNIRQKQSLETRREKLKTFKDKGLSLSQVGKIVGLSRQRVHQILDRDYLMRRKKLSPPPPGGIDSASD